MQNASLDEAQAGIKIARRNINSLRYADETTLMSEREEKIKSLLMRVKEDSVKAGLNSTFKKVRSWHPPHHFMANRWGKKKKIMADFIFLGSKITADGDGSHEIKRCLLLGRKAMTNLWPMTYDKEHIKKQRHHFIDKIPYSPSYMG